MLNLYWRTLPWRWSLAGGQTGKVKSCHTGELGVPGAVVAVFILGSATHTGTLIQWSEGRGVVCTAQSSTHYYIWPTAKMPFW